VSFSDSRASWAATHVTHLACRRFAGCCRSFRRCTTMVADGGEAILYAAHVTRIFSAHPEIYEIGCHCRDYVVKQWDRFSHVHVH
jgi:hypothetical protein